MYFILSVFCAFIFLYVAFCRHRHIGIGPRGGAAPQDSDGWASRSGGLVRLSPDAERLRHGWHRGAGMHNFMYGSDKFLGEFGPA